jgi:hypothetical protein
MKGAIITVGTKAVTIQTENKQQYYAPLENMDDLIFASVETDMPIFVTFDIDTTQYSGHSNGKPRYYAKNVQLQDTVTF